MIGNIIQQKRKEAGLTQAQLADRLGVSAPAVNRWEKDLSFPDATLLAPLARCLKTDLNELFSFYDSLSTKERELIVDKARMMLLNDSDKNALQYIENVLRENLSDGNLYKEMADMLFGWHTIKRVQSPQLYLSEIAQYYERALELLPEKVEVISGSLMNVYGEMGKAEKAEEAWSRLPQTKHDKQWAHAELHYLLKDYALASSEVKTLVLRKVVDLSRSLNFLHDVLSMAGEEELADLADEKDAAIRELFGLWRGLGVINRVSTAIGTQPDDAEEVKLSDMIARDFGEDKFTTCPLFDGVKLGGLPGDESTTADLVADLLATLQKLPSKEGK